jgi:tryptophan 2,3-dioxygenase
MIAAVGIAVLILIFIASSLKRQRGSALNPDEFMARWKDLQKYCAQRKTWPLAIVEADNLLADALKKRRYKGKTTGERLVAAQRTLTDNEGVWFGHKLRNRIVHEDVRKLRKQDVLEGLNGFRQALRDLGALEV